MVFTRVLKLVIAGGVQSQREEISSPLSGLVSIGLVQGSGAASRRHRALRRWPGP
jgi:hypothetical protein